jgi:hypothetical protein
MLKALTFAGVLVSSAIIAIAQPAQAASIMIDGRGASRCSDITVDYASHPTAVANDMMGWAYGYMTRRNIERAAAGKTQVNLQTEKFGPKEMVGMMLKFCQDQPDVRYYQAVDALFNVLAQDQGLTS